MDIKNAQQPQQPGSASQRDRPGNDPQRINPTDTASRETNGPPDRVEVASMDSFPCSDPPGYSFCNA